MDFSIIDLLQTNLLSPMVLAFALGVGAVFLKSDLRFPEPIYAILSIYLLLAIGMKGGVTLSQSSFSVMLPGLLATLTLGAVVPFLAFSIMRFFKYSRVDAAALAAHFGSVSVITFIASQVFVEALGYHFEKYITALVAILEVPAIIIGLLLARKKTEHPLWIEIKGIVVSKSVLLLIGGLIIGYLSGPKGFDRISPLFVEPFQGMLVLFLREMGLVAGQKLQETGRIHPSLVAAGIVIPLINGTLGAVLAKFCGMDVGTATVFACIAASASYIAAPAAVRMALPQANPGYYLTTSLAITFPFNLGIGIPLYHKIVLWMMG